MSANPKCAGEGCALRLVCYRFNSKPTANQEYYDKPPIKMHFNKTGLNKGRTFLCEGFWVLHEDHKKWVKLSNQLKKEDKELLRGIHT